MYLSHILLWMTFVGPGLSQYMSEPFDIIYSDACAEAGIDDFHDCPNQEKSRWSKTIRTEESSAKYQTVTLNQSKCYYKLVVQQQYCTSVPLCVRKFYRYNLPRPFKKGQKCNGTFSIESECEENGPGGNNTRTAYSQCLTKGIRSYCTVKFEECIPKKRYEWTSFRRLCYVPCSGDGYQGVAMRVVRRCQECNGDFVDDKYCKGEAFQIRKCIQRSEARRNVPDCLVDTTESISTTHMTITALSPSISVRTSSQRTNDKREQDSTTAMPTLTSTLSYTFDIATVTSSEAMFPRSTFSEKSSPVSVTSRSNTTGSNLSVTTERYSIKSEETTPFAIARPRVLNPSKELGSTNLPSFTKHTRTTARSTHELVGGEVAPFDIATAASAAGAGLLFLLIIIVIVVVLARRKNKKYITENSVSISSSSYRRKSSRNAVVDSSSFRIATWIRERPSLPNGGDRSPTDSVVSDAEYWKIGKSADDLTASYVSSRHDDESMQTQDVDGSLPNGQGQEHIYDEVSSTDKEVTAPPGDTSNTDQPDVSRNINQPTETSLNHQPPIYAVVQRSRKKDMKEKSRKRSSASSTSDVRKRIASNHSITCLNNRQLRDGVLEIEFDGEEGVKCKISESDIYINLDETEAPTAL